MWDTILAVALGWTTLLLAGGGLVLLRSRSRMQRLIAFDLLASLLVALLALLSFLRGTSYYLDAALALALLSFVSTLAAARYHTGDGPFS
jgi:multicomponent Na+:H+ antiporter subunit F